MKRTSVLALGLLVGLVTGHRAFAYQSLTCAEALALVGGHPGIEANSIVSTVLNQWEAMDRRTAAGGHEPIAQQMMTTPSAIDALSDECVANPAQTLGAAAAQVYRVAREQIDGF